MNIKLLQKIEELTLYTIEYTDGGDAGKTIITDFTYDAKKRLETTTETTGYGAVFKIKLEYDAWGRVEKETKTASLNGKTSTSGTQNEYKNGFAYKIYEIKNGQKTKTLWETTEVNAQGQLTKATLGNGIAINNIYDSYGYVTTAKHTLGMTTTMELGTNFDTQRGNLKWRKNSLFGNVTENFDYDSQDRLIQYPNAQGVQENQTYEDDGRIKSNKLGTYNYGNSNKKYQNTSIALTASALPDYQNKPLQTVSYNTFKSPVEIVEDGKDKISFVYNAHNNRSVMFYGGLGLKETRTYRKHYSADGTMEIKENTQTGAIEFVTYIGGDGYSAPVVYKKAYSNVGAIQEQTLYLHRDYQGSILAITNETGAIVEKRKFDAWGAIEKVQDGAGNILNDLTILDRGYTGHEHLQSVGLIHMNGRLYDPKLHRFLQPDNYVQDPGNTQNYNRYGYVLNNPLKYTDPSGEFKINLNDIIAGVAIAVGTVLSATGVWAPVGAVLIGAGVAHFGAAYAEYTKTGDWNAASNNAGISFSATVTTDFGYDDSKNHIPGVTQNAPVVGPKTSDSFLGITGALPIAGATWAEGAAGTALAEGTLEWIALDAVTPDPLDAAWPKWVGYGIAGGGAAAYLYSGDYIEKMTREIEGIKRRTLGPQGFVYELVATKNGPYPNLNTGGTIDLKIGDVWKYGQTTQGFGRYSLNKLEEKGLKMVPIPPGGNQMEILIQEKYYIYGYYFYTGERPPGNPIFR
ncbi:RHS repeat domain-containing protein [Flavobacterium sp. MDT1-60]|uniref:RHS repeat domain-containing protein n=1 Tax=Flavobacterium sp. MDT1-60 TaxID=1979344 RepID=UPI001781354B|nr:RHS repeat-associated core domain-containing protein [Flavobacterium sp. MDT1-60]QOG04745.1 RHS repeat-associated core domain-containing protein [Flavobacterium sp. MDT1-60]